jgi:hypothetical protein
MTRYNRSERIALLDEVLDSLRTLLQDPSVGPRNRQSLIVSVAGALDKLRAEESKLTPAQVVGREEVSSGGGASRIDFGAEFSRLDAVLRKELGSGDND